MNYRRSHHIDSLIHLTIISLLGLLIAACVSPRRQQTPEAMGVEQTLETFWTALRSGNQAILDRQLTADATFTRVEGRQQGSVSPLSAVLEKAADRTLLINAERERLINFQQPTPQHASAETFFDITRPDGIQRGRIHWDLVRNDKQWLLHRVKTSVWTFPKPSHSTGP